MLVVYTIVLILTTLVTKIRTGNIILTIAGIGTSGYSGDGGAATSAQLDQPSGIVVDSNGNLYFNDYSNHVVRRVSTAGIITAFVGTGTAGYNKDNVAATSSELYGPQGLGMDASGRYIKSELSSYL